jgi:hypothetical protein
MMFIARALPVDKPVKKSQPDPDPLKACVRNLLDQGGRSEEEATAWCRDYLAMKPDTDEAWRAR